MCPYHRFSGVTEVRWTLSGSRMPPNITETTTQTPIPVYPALVLGIDSKIANPGCISYIWVPRDVASWPKAAENPDAVLRAGAGMLPLGVKAGGGMALPCDPEAPHPGHAQGSGRELAASAPASALPAPPRVFQAESLP